VVVPLIAERIAPGELECNAASAHPCDAFAYWSVISGERFVGIGMAAVDAARAMLLLVCGYSAD
jgi:hypothetical protein